MLSDVKGWKNARSSANPLANQVAEMAARCHAEPDDLSPGTPALARRSADARICREECERIIGNKAARTRKPSSPLCPACPIMYVLITAY
jgi:hypothetical protein